MKSDAKPLVYITWRDRLADKSRKLVLPAIGAALLGGMVLVWLTYNYATARQQYPVRSVLYQVTETVHYAGTDHGSKYADSKSDTIIERGSDDNTKLGDVIGDSHYDRSDRIMQFTLFDQRRTRLAFASEKREPVLGGLRLSGAIDFREQQAEVLGQKGRFITYTFIPQHGLRNVQLNLFEDESRQLHLINELVTNRRFGLGWLYGERFRHSTEINEFTDTPGNQAIKDELIRNIATYNSNTSNLSVRDKALRHILQLEEKLERVAVIASYEDGYFAWLPQESTTFLFGNPSLGTRLRTPFTFRGKIGEPKYPAEQNMVAPPEFKISNPKNDVIKLRVESYWDMWPGNIWPLSKLSFGSGSDVVRPFGHQNLGGYTINDARGVIAQIDMEDFALHFGDDVVYHYYLDKNADGKIDKERELVGRVLYGVSQDQRELEANKGDVVRDTSQRFIYTFMAGFDPATREIDFYLCNTIESFLLNEVNRGYGQHSVLGYINEHRSDVLLLNHVSVQNLARSLTPESAAVAKYDILVLMRAAGRRYVDDYVIGLP